MRFGRTLSAFIVSALLLTTLPGCLWYWALLHQPDDAMDDGPIAEGISARLGDPMPSATTEQLDTFTRGKEVALRRFDFAEGLGPAFNVTFCGACHEKPEIGGSAGLYRNFFLAGSITADGAFVFSDSAGPAGGVLRLFDFAPAAMLRPEIPDTTSVFAQRNPIPFFGAGLLAELSDEEILSRADPNDEDGDGISGRPNFDRGFVGRFGRKSQTVSLEGFIRGPLFNHLGITTVPLSEEQRARLPVDSSGGDVASTAKISVLPEEKLGPHSQAAAPDAPNFDDDGVADPEMSQDDLFDLVSFQMLLGAPKFDTPTEQSNRGRLLFHEANCSGCHVPRLNGPRGPIPAYSDLLLHDMGPDLADGIVMKEASGAEFRTAPLWGVCATGPFLHDGRAATLEDAILAHGGEAEPARDAFEAFNAADRADVIEFLLSLGGRSQISTGLLKPNQSVPGVGEYGGPLRELSSDEMAQFVRGREVFDRDFNFSTGAGGLAGPDDPGRFNGDSCRACHFDPAIGGSGPRGVNVMRHGTVDPNGVFSPPADTPNTILHREIRLGVPMAAAGDGINVFEPRQTPHTFGAGLLDAISEETILSNADPNDDDDDGISGRANVIPNDGRIGRFGWKADVPNSAEFVRDATAAEIGITMPMQEGLTFGITEDEDGVPDPEISLQDLEDLDFFLAMLAPPPRQTGGDADQIAAGEQMFETVGCAQCHIPSLPTELGMDANLYSDLLLHEILPEGMAGIESADATQREFRTAPLWGLSQTAPYFHTGAADTIDEAIRMHDGEAATVRDAYIDLSDSDREALLAFLGSL